MSSLSLSSSTKKEIENAIDIHTSLFTVVGELCKAVDKEGDDTKALIESEFLKSLKELCSKFNKNGYDHYLDLIDQVKTYQKDIKNMYDQMKCTSYYCKLESLNKSNTCNENSSEKELKDDRVIYLEKCLEDPEIIAYEDMNASYLIGKQSDSHLNKHTTETGNSPVYTICEQLTSLKSLYTKVKDRRDKMIERFRISHNRILTLNSLLCDPQDSLNLSENSLKLEANYWEEKGLTEEEGNFLLSWDRELGESNYQKLEDIREAWEKKVLERTTTIKNMILESQSLLTELRLAKKDCNEEDIEIKNDYKTK